MNKDSIDLSVLETKRCELSGRNVYICAPIDGHWEDLSIGTSDRTTIIEYNGFFIATHLYNVAFYMGHKPLHESLKKIIDNPLSYFKNVAIVLQDENPTNALFGPISLTDGDKLTWQGKNFLQAFQVFHKCLINYQNLNAEIAFSNKLLNNDFKPDEMPMFIKESVVSSLDMENPSFWIRCDRIKFDDIWFTAGDKRYSIHDKSVKVCKKRYAIFVTAKKVNDKYITTIDEIEIEINPNDDNCWLAL